MTRSSLLTIIVLFIAVLDAPAQELGKGVEFKGHTFQVERTALSSDGKILASGGGNSRGRELKLWDATTGAEIASLTGSNKSLD